MRNQNPPAPVLHTWGINYWGVFWDLLVQAHCLPSFHHCDGQPKSNLNLPPDSVKLLLGGNNCSRCGDYRDLLVFLVPSDEEGESPHPLNDTH